MTTLRITWTPREDGDMGLQITAGRVLDRMHTLVRLELTRTLCRATVEGDAEDLHEDVLRCLAFAATDGSIHVTRLEPMPTCDVLTADIEELERIDVPNESTGQDPGKVGH